MKVLTTRRSKGLKRVGPGPENETGDIKNEMVLLQLSRSPQKD